MKQKCGGCLTLTKTMKIRILEITLFKVQSQHFSQISFCRMIYKNLPRRFCFYKKMLKALKKNYKVFCERKNKLKMASLFSYVAESHDTFFAFCLIKFQIWSFLSIIGNFEICEASISCKKYLIHLMGDFVILAIFMSPTVHTYIIHFKSRA